jgi:hypothetical protein
VVLVLQSCLPITTDYKEAISLSCAAMLRGESPYSVLCATGSPMTPGPGYLLLFIVSGLFLAPGLVPVIGLFLCVALARPSERWVAFLILAPLTIRSTIWCMDYLFAGGALCWLLLL